MEAWDDLQKKPSVSADEHAEGSHGERRAHLKPPAEVPEVINVNRLDNPLKECVDEKINDVERHEKQPKDVGKALHGCHVSNRAAEAT